MQRKELMVDAGDATLATEAFGTPERGTILLAMGATASMLWWPEALMKALAAGGYQAIRFDHRDTGQSTTGAPGEIGYDIHVLAADLMAILGAYGADKAHLVGMSLGGYVAQLDALSFPGRIRSLTLIASEPLGIAYEGEGISDEFMLHFGHMAELDWSDRNHVTAFLLGIARLSAGSAVPFDAMAATNRIWRELDRTDSMQSAFNHSMVGGELEPGQSIAGLTQPLLIIHGTEDPVISIAAARASAEAVPGATLLELDGRGHEILAQDVPAIAAAILAHCGAAP